MEKSGFHTSFHSSAYGSVRHCNRSDRDRDWSRRFFKVEKRKHDREPDEFDDGDKPDRSYESPRRDRREPGRREALGSHENSNQRESRKDRK